MKEPILSLREQQELREHEFFSPFAAFSDRSAGRDRKEDPCDIRTIYQRDRDRILHSKAFRRLKAKTQVFMTPEGDHYRTRMTHTLEVSQIARTIARALRLNEDLTEAVALGHDLGHTPFGHAGERALNRVCKDGFEHNKQSIRVVEVLEKHGEGLNLSKEVRDGILNHQSKGNPMTLEGRIVRIADKIAYINHDIDDAIRGKIMKEDDIPRRFTDCLGDSLGKRLDILTHDIVRSSMGIPDIRMSPEVEQAMFGLRNYMFENVYTNPRAKGEEKKAELLLELLYHHYMEHPELLPDHSAIPLSRRVCDYIAGMTEGYAVARFNEMVVPNAWGVL